jgi:DDE family transposase
VAVLGERRRPGVLVEAKDRRSDGLGEVEPDREAQAAVAAEREQLVRGAFDAAPDAQLLGPMLDQLAENLAAVDASLPDGAALLGDAGYMSEHNVLITEAHGLDPHLAAGRVKHTDPPTPAPSESLPEPASTKQLMAAKLATDAGAALYSRRKTIVEPVFGQMQTVQDARQLRLRGKRAARAQHRFQSAVHNLLKLHRNGGLALIPTG